MVLSCFYDSWVQKMLILNFILVTSNTLSGWLVYESKSVHTCTVYPGVRLGRRNHKIWVIFNQVLPDLCTLMTVVFINLAASEVTH